MDVVRLCLDSMLAGVKDLSYELLVWDNESTQDFRAMLGSYKPTVFTQSVNIGAHNARHALVEMASAPIICVTDDDVLFSPDWLHYQLELLTVLPNVGLVSGTPQHTAFRAGVQHTIDWAMGNKECRVKFGHLVPKEWEKDFCISVGRDYKRYTSDPRWQKLLDFEIEYHGVFAYAHGHHMQFLAYRDTIAPFVKRLPVLLDNKYLFNIPIDDAGLLQLTTQRRTAIHIGNVIDPSITRIHEEWKVRA